MKERPIPFKTQMVRALLAGTKTQTRRVVNPAPMMVEDHRCVPWDGNHSALMLKLTDAGRRCPYGQPGDRLWVREAFDFIPSGGPDEPQACEIVYWATGSLEPRTAPSEYNPMIYGREKVRPSIHMPRWASRITLEVTGVRVERLQDISREDAWSEGCNQMTASGLGLGGEDAGQEHFIYGGYARKTFAALWESINGDGSWDANPWVWVIEFKRVMP